MKELLERLEKAEQREKEAYTAWEQNPESEELETEFNEAYKALWDAFNSLAEKIQSITGIDEKIARWMVTTTYRAELKKIINKIA